MNNLIHLVKEFPNLKIEISAEELLATVRSVATEIVEHYEKTEVPETYLSRKQTSEMLGVDLSTLWRWDKEEYLHTVKVGTKVRYKLSDINRILAGKGGVKWGD